MSMEFSQGWDSPIYRPVTKSLSASQLRESLADFERHEGKRLPSELACCFVASEIIMIFLGPKWVNCQIFGAGKPAAYMRSARETELEQYQHQHRVIRLGEMLFNFQGLPGFDKRILDIASRASSQVEAAIWELEAAELFFRSSIPFRFVEGSGEKGKDYDIEIKLGKIAVACETKCKVEDTQPSSNTVFNSLSKARDQLPDDIPAIVSLKVPESWVRREETRRQIDSAISEFFGSSKRVSSIILRFESWGEIKSSYDTPLMAACIMCSTFHSKNARHSLVEYGKIICHPFSDNSWVGINAITGRNAVRRLR